MGSQAGRDMATPWSSRAAAFSDYDNDGDLDIAVLNLDGLLSLYRNETGSGPGHWLNLALEGVKINRSAIGARVAVEIDGGKQIREVRSGSSFQASSDLRLHFGLGSTTRNAIVKVQWAPGRQQTFSEVQIDRRYRVKEEGPLEVLR